MFMFIMLAYFICVIGNYPHMLLFSTPGNYLMEKKIYIYIYIFFRFDLITVSATQYFIRELCLFL